MSAQRAPSIRVECDTLVGLTARIIVVDSGEDISDRVTGVDIAMRVGEVTKITLHTRGTLDVVGELDQDRALRARVDRLTEALTAIREQGGPLHVWEIACAALEDGAV